MKNLYIIGIIADEKNEKYFLKNNTKEKIHTSCTVIPFDLIKCNKKEALEKGNSIVKSCIATVKHNF